ncbi:hypothetical protein ACFQL0_06080 [Haloplanus litoreus]|uniref:hypothetical protein n=1 Tax=Haloplanus litoreus TaxID=767515 RepID=UPI003618B635
MAARRRRRDSDGDSHPPFDVVKRETVELAHETGIAAVVDLLLDVRVAVLLLALLGLVILLVVTDTLPARK